MSRKMQVFNLIRLLLIIVVSIFLEASADQAYFLQNVECTSQQSCVGDIHDVSVVCLNLRCVCDPRLGIYDRVRFQCVGKADHACLGNLCTRNAACDSSSNTCKCLPGYDMSPEGYCVHSHDEPCEEDEDCKNGLLCGYHRKCECIYPNHQYYHEENDTCVSIAKTWNNGQNYVSLSNSSTSSPFLQYLQALLTFCQVCCFIAIAVILARLGMTLREVIGTFKLHGYFLRSGLETKINEGSMHIESTPFFDGGKV